MAYSHTLIGYEELDPQRNPTGVKKEIVTTDPKGWLAKNKKDVKVLYDYGVDKSKATGVLKSQYVAQIPKSREQYGISGENVEKLVVSSQPPGTVLKADTGKLEFIKQPVQEDVYVATIGGKSVGVSPGIAGKIAEMQEQKTPSQSVADVFNESFKQSDAYKNKLENNIIVMDTSKKDELVSGYVSNVMSGVQNKEIVPSVIAGFGARITPKDPLGLRSIVAVGSGVFKGKSPSEIKSELDKITFESVEWWGQQTLKNTGEMKDPFTYLAGTVPQTATGQMAISMGAGYVVGGALKSTAPLITTLGSSSKVLSGAGQFIVSHPKIVEAGGYAVDVGFGALKASKMKKSGYSGEQIISELGKDVLVDVSFGKGFMGGFDAGLPIKYSMVDVDGNILWQGVSLETGRKGYPLIGKADSKVILGKPIVDISDDALKKGIIPMSPTETSILTGAVTKKYPESELLRLQTGLDLMDLTQDVKSKYVVGFDFADIKYVPENVADDLEKWIRKQDDILVYGSVSQKAQMGEKMSRIPKDIDIVVPDAPGKAQELYDIFAKGVGKENVKLTDNLVELNTPTGWHHAVDVHEKGIEAVEGVSSKWYETEYIGFGFKRKDVVKIGEIETPPLGEQGIRKGVSSLTLREVGVDPKSHRMKDVGDFVEVQDALIESMDNPLKKASGKSMLETFESTRQKSATLDVKESVLLYDSNIKNIPSMSINIAKNLEVPSPSQYTSPSVDVLSVSPGVALGPSKSVALKSQAVVSPYVPPGPPSVSPPTSPSVSASIPVMEIGSPSPSYGVNKLSSPSPASTELPSVNTYLVPSVNLSPPPPSINIPPPSIASPPPIMKSPPMPPSISPPLQPPSKPPKPPEQPLLSFNPSVELGSKRKHHFGFEFGYEADIGSFMKGFSSNIPKMEKVFSGIEIRPIKIRGVGL